MRCVVHTMISAFTLTGSCLWMAKENSMKPLAFVVLNVKSMHGTMLVLIVSVSVCEHTHCKLLPCLCPGQGTGFQWEFCTAKQTWHKDNKSSWLVYMGQFKLSCAVGKHWSHLWKKKVLEDLTSCNTPLSYGCSNETLHSKDHPSHLEDRFPHICSTNTYISMAETHTEI